MSDEQEKTRDMIVETLNDLLTEALNEDSDRIPVCIAGTMLFDNGEHQAFFAGDLNRVAVVGVLTDLIMQIWFEAKNREINQIVENQIKDAMLAHLPGAGGTKPN